MSRLVIPVRWQGIVTGWQARYFGDDKKQSKYISAKFRNGPFFNMVTPGNKSNTVILVEDIISSHIIGRYVPCIAVLGSPAMIPSALVHLIKDDYDHIIPWLDADKAKTAIGWSKRLQAIYGVKSNPIFTRTDPKDTPEDGIKIILDIHHETMR